MGLSTGPKGINSPKSATNLSKSALALSAIMAMTNAACSDATESSTQNSTNTTSGTGGASSECDNHVMNVSFEGPAPQELSTYPDTGNEVMYFTVTNEGDKPDCVVKFTSFETLFTGTDIEDIDSVLLKDTQTDMEIADPDVNPTGERFEIPNFNIELNHEETRHLGLYFYPTDTATPGNEVSFQSGRGGFGVNVDVEGDVPLISNKHTFVE